MSQPSVARPSKSYVEAARLKHPQTMSREEATRPAKGNTPLGLPVCLVPCRPTPCTAGSWCRTDLSGAITSVWPQGFGWYSPKPSQKSVSEIAAKLRPYEWTAAQPPPGAAFVQGSGVQMMDAMYEATKAGSGQVPSKLRGVFWMQGNGVGEELVTLQFGEWDASQRTLLTPLAPFSWGWPNGKPTDAPFGGRMYTPGLIEGGARTLLNEAGVTILTTPGTAAYQFSAEPAQGTLSSARLDVFVGNSRVSILNGWGYGFYGMTGTLRAAWLCCAPCCWPLSQAFTLDELEDGNPALNGEAWHRGIRWGCCGVTCVPFGGYTLLKVIDGEGRPTRHHADFVEYIGDVPVWTWAGNATSGYE
ncbi:hypothetical protein EMIHUDRAFT_450135 [Emiliania huxleyi CCMP1516]|uniref:Sialate O-acetylesterase domain-containing protein n=2 Tax=Emiliania huxleyi TaxID=2903 RepID=A0A0D3JU84_EMIH1|nr:hypothetical protein EMIHUDRAFT_450135 [Emiliania huxleyi CCMP1516]EOD27069.1 hypothetical protein EMIHUDRAFT_450135 [Emiliania huxleyi CCMP1516]|eukprot:XP_005779498.1 hypothetical protein EMIHUDRAFT_450135 [Emiliania huxleyi CCMP1516]